MDLRDTPAEAAFRKELLAWLSRQDFGWAAGPPSPLRSRRSREWAAALHAAGYAGVMWPVEHGGRGLGPAHHAIVAEECGRAGAPDPVTVIGLNMVGPTLIEYGTADQRARHLAGILRGEQVFCQGFSEPEAGSDLGSLRTAARRRPGGFVVDGRKVWSSYAVDADHCLLLARTDQQSTGHAGITCFLLDLRSPGVQVEPVRQINGLGEFGEIRLDGVSIDDSCVLGEVGRGWPVAMTTLAHERGVFGMTLAGRLAADFERLLATVRATGRAGDPLIRDEVGRLAHEVQAMLWTARRALSTVSRTGSPGPESTVVKLHWSATHQRLTALALRVLGGDLLTDPSADGEKDGDENGAAGPGSARHWVAEALHSRGDSLAGGTSEILRTVVAERVAGLPRSR